jgi:hypothetical protein
MLALIGLAGVTGCSQKESVLNTVVSPTTDKEADMLRVQFQGKYKIVSSLSDVAIDVNQDGVASTNMLQEIPDLALDNQTKYNVELRITDPSLYNPAYTPANYPKTPEYFFVQWWPEQFIRTGPGKVWDNNEKIAYNPNYVVDYEFQSTLRKFSFSSDHKQITVIPDDNGNPFRWIRPESVTVQDNGQLKTVNKRRVYTSAGVTDVIITTVYERFTTIT